VGRTGSNWMSAVPSLDDRDDTKTDVSQDEVL
jgi:hypothetical protein